MTDPKRLLFSATLLLAIALPTACGGGPEDEAEADQVVDVQPAVEVPEVEDPKEIPRKGTGLSGILPGGFPDDVPLYLPASLVDYGDVEGGRSYVELLSPRGRSAVEQGLGGQLRGRGWAPGAAGDGGTVLTKDGRTLRLAFADGPTGTTYRIEY